jgi:two-component system LytT family response regulator
MLRAVIIEDEKNSREALTELLSRYCRQVEVLAEADGLNGGRAAIRRYHPDIIFLDILMPDGSGFKLLEETGDIDFDVIFVTAFDQYAIQAIKYSALDYLLKPVIPEELVAAVEKAEKKKLSKEKNRNIQVLLENIRSGVEKPRKIVLSTADKIHVVEVDHILRCESDNYYTKFFFTDGKTLLVSRTLKEHETLLSGHDFIRPHKSHLVNTKYIKGYLKHDGGFIQMTDGSQIPVSRRKREQIIEIISNL